MLSQLRSVHDREHQHVFFNLHSLICRNRPFHLYFVYQITGYASVQRLLRVLWPRLPLAYAYIQHGEHEQEGNPGGGVFPSSMAEMIESLKFRV